MPLFLFPVHSTQEVVIFWRLSDFFDRHVLFICIWVVFGSQYTFDKNNSRSRNIMLRLFKFYRNSKFKNLIRVKQWMCTQDCLQFMASYHQRLLTSKTEDIIIVMLQVSSFYYDDMFFHCNHVQELKRIQAELETNVRLMVSIDNGIIFYVLHTKLINQLYIAIISAIQLANSNLLISCQNYCNSR